MMNWAWLKELFERLGREGEERKVIRTISLKV